MMNTTYEENISSSSRLLILSCSQKKRPTKELLPALERYDGPAFRVLNKFQRSNSLSEKLPDVYIMSAKYGLIPGSQLIPFYDQKLNLQRIKKLQEPTLTKLENLLSENQYIESFLSMGKNYLQVLDGYNALTSVNHNVIVSEGSMGCKLAELRHWLYQGESSFYDNLTKPVGLGKASLRGIEITLTPEQVIEIINDALTVETEIPKYNIWYVQIKDKKVPPKWIVSQLTGLPLSDFHTNDARRVLQQIGIMTISKFK